MSQLQILSGLGDKAPAAMLLDTPDARLLIELGGPLEPGLPRGWDLPDDRPVDAVVISHDHVDHMGAVDLLTAGMPVYATEPVAASLPLRLDRRRLPLQGQIDLAGVTLRCGQAGHSLGGVWLHFEIGGGVLYSGDFSLESTLFRFDPPPPAALALLDASYGLYDRAQDECRKALERCLIRPTLLPVPASGRALEMALWLDDLGISWAMDQRCAEQLDRLLTLPDGCFQPGARSRLARLAVSTDLASAQVVLVGSPEGIGPVIEPLIARGDRQLIYTGYLPPKARGDVQSGRAQWLRWNVHPRASDLCSLAEAVNAEQVVPLFTSLEDACAWRGVLGPRLYRPQDAVIALD
ncbi:MBL fold metallo-hydrolase [Marinobacterium zhoushanense]|uniref:MBL fold metallo-hydrolase n=1 Tax=Marinobacterium zhoushanense TaxID=1679163 RepID=A0ABQ1KNE5_9GAMM|nr:MBL fold metallo-hydrolase [Marinobacterium zhoushanense]GGC05668.1 MBL fold metallo-hydrolase [Marinobacterium zhoushanense]